MQPEVPNEGQLAYDLVFGTGERQRSTAPEASLLPHLGSKLCHDFSIEEVLDVTRSFAFEGGSAPPWLPLWEATLWGIAGRDDLGDALDYQGIVSRKHWQIIRILRQRNTKAAAELFEARIEIGPGYPPVAGLARLAPLLPRKNVEALLEDPLLEPTALDPESARAIMEAANANSLRLADDLIDAALNGTFLTALQESRVAHLLPVLPQGIRAEAADKLATWVCQHNLLPDAVALWVSRIAPFVSSKDIWDLDQLIGSLEPIWRNHVEQLLHAPWPKQPWADVFRAHPEFERIPAITRPHETTASAAHEIFSRWMPLAAAAAPERSAPGGALDDLMGLERSAGIDFDLPDDILDDVAAASPDIPEVDVEPEIQSPPVAPRRLQADIKHEESDKVVDAFVANQVHLVDISIGRKGQVSADREIERELEDIFKKKDVESIDLPVWFHANGEAQSGSINVPRNLVQDSDKAQFKFTASADNRVLARVHVMRPGGRMLLQSAILAGDVVPDVATAVNHKPGMQLTVDVEAGNLGDPADAEQGSTLVADESIGVTQVDGTPVEVNVSQIQDFLRKLVHEIETAADRHDLDEAAVDRTLVALAMAGQQLRILVDAQLAHLKNANPLQIVSLLNGDILPLELVYDGPPLAVNSKICPTWRDAMRSGHCGNCAGGGPDGDDAPARVCPMRFWSMSKVIERRSADARGGPFRVFAERSASRTKLRAVDALLISASGRVEPAAVTDLQDFAQTDLSVPAQTAQNWKDWTQQVGAGHPELLVAMPHNESLAHGLVSALLLGEPTDDAMEVPAEATLLAGSVTNEYVHSTDEAPGPIVLLLGCDTQFEEGRLSAFAGEFRENGAAITVGTIGELRADQAPLAARVLVDGIVRPPSGAKTVGDLLLTARRHLLADGLIMALLLVANGDAEWQLPG